MNFIDRVTGNDITKAYKLLEIRVQQLPKEYQVIWEEMKTVIWTNSSDIIGRKTLPFMEELVELLEMSALDELDVSNIVGDDIQAFCLELLGQDSVKSYRDKWRQQLNRSVMKKLGKVEKK